MDILRLRPAAWYVVLSVVGTLALCGVIRLLWSGMPTVVLVAAPIGAAVGIFTMATLEVDETGIAVAGRRSAWRDLELTRSRFGETLRTRRGTAPRREQVGAFLPLYEANWRDGAIGRFRVATWAPHLLSPTDLEA